MSDWLILPVVVPLLAGALLLIGAPLKLHWHRTVSGVTTLLLLLIAVRLFLVTGDGTVNAYLIGDWPAPFGIILVLDRLAALMLLLTSVLGVGALAYAMLGVDRAAPGFHALFLFQLLGLNGAFLTGDLFNLFVFFEILLIASYGLLLHGGGAARTRAGLHYVVLNLAGSSLFLIALGLIYGVTGTLNMADLAMSLPQLDAGDLPLAGAGALLLLVVFALKAAVLPLHFWLPHAYSNASAPVAALFAIMTKVGVYAIVRVFGLVFGYGDGPLADVIAPWLLPAALLTLAIGTFGVVASRDLQEMTAYLIIVSVGTLLTGIGVGTDAGLTAALYYLIHTTLVTAGLFLLADVIAYGRPQGTLIAEGRRPPDSALLGVLFLVGSVAIAGMPPLSGLIGKLLLLSAAQSSSWAPWIWAGILGSSLLVIVGLTRAGAALFWRGEPISRGSRGALRIAPAALLLATSPLLVAFGGTIAEFTSATASQISDGTAYMEAVAGLFSTSPEVTKAAR